MVRRVCAVNVDCVGPAAESTIGRRRDGVAQYRREVIEHATNLVVVSPWL